MATTPDRFACDLCGAEFDSPSELQDHKQDHLRPAQTESEDDKDIRRDIGAPGLPTSPVSEALVQGKSEVLPLYW